MASKWQPRRAESARPGEPVPATARTSPAEAADGVALGPRTPPRTGPTEEEIRARAHALGARLGSVAHAVIHHATAPVAVVPNP